MNTRLSLACATRRVVVVLALAPIAGFVGCSPAKAPTNRATEAKKGRGLLRPGTPSGPGGRP